MVDKFHKTANAFRESDKNFFQAYWKAWLFLGIGLLTIVALVVLLVTSSNSRNNNGSITLVSIALAPSLAIVLWQTIKAPRDIQSTYQNVKRNNDNDGCFSLIVMSIIMVVQFCIRVVLFSIFEPIKQGLFLRHAWQAWQNGETLVDEQGNPVRGA